MNRLVLCKARRGLTTRLAKSQLAKVHKDKGPLVWKNRGKSHLMSSSNLKREVNMKLKADSGVSLENFWALLSSKKSKTWTK